MRLNFSEKQNEYIANADRRWGLKIGAVRSGKSFVDIAHVVPYRLRALKDEAGLNVILGVSKETIERNVLQPMREIYTDKLIGTINSRNIANVCGVDVYCLGAEKVSQVAKIQGSSIKYCYGDEIAKWNKDVFAMLQSRLDKPYSRFDGSCNPEYPGHWLKDFIDNPEIDAYIQKYTIFDNPFLPKEFVDNLCKEYAGTVYYKRYILGEWALAEGLIYPMYEDAIEKPPDRTAERYIMSLDYGTQNAFAAILWGKYGDVWYALREYYYSGRDTGTQKTDEEYGEGIEKFVEDIDGNIKVTVDPSAASFIALLRKKPKFSVLKADNDVADGIRETATAMQTGRIKISPDMVNWKKEVEGYVWDDTVQEDKPVKVNDHCLTGDTEIETFFGKRKIKNLVGKIGLVWSYKRGKRVLRPFFGVRMTQRKQQIYRITCENGKTIRCTGEHRILTENGWKKAKYLKQSDKIVDIMDAGMNTRRTNIKRPITVKVVGVELDGIEDVYNMEVLGTHNFAVNGGLIVHNCMDAMRYFVKTFRIATKRRDNAPLLWG